MIKGWNRGNGKAFAMPFTENAEIVGFGSIHPRRRQETATLQQQLFDTCVMVYTIVSKVRSVHFLMREIAVIHAVNETVIPYWSGLEPSRNSVRMLAVAKYNGQ